MSSGERPDSQSRAVNATDPIVVGAVGGSGTRVVTRILRDVGIFMGSNLNNAEDSVPLMAWYEAWARRLLETKGELAPAETRSARTMFDACLADHLRHLPGPGASWGIKVPRSILFLSWWTDAFPRLRFVHVIRNGLDMAYSADMNQVRLFGDLMLSRAERRLPPRVQAIAHWSRANLAATAFAEAHLGPRYLQLRFESLCAEPTQEVARLLDFLGLAAGASRDRAIAEVAAPATIGRWREHPATELWRIMRVGRTGLERFSYWDPDAWDHVCRNAAGAGRLRRLSALRQRVLGWARQREA